MQGQIIFLSSSGSPVTTLHGQNALPFFSLFLLSPSIISCAYFLSGLTFHPFFSATFSAFSIVQLIFITSTSLVFNFNNSGKNLKFDPYRNTKKDKKWKKIRMKKNFESELRIIIKDIHQFLKKLEKFNGKVVRNYKFNDYMYIPKNPSSEWNLNKKTMRLREHLLPDTYARILFTENDVIPGKTFQFKQSKYPQGKIELYSGDIKTAEALLDSWDFRLFFKIEKTDGKLYEVRINEKQTFIVAVEDITQLGYSAEIELWGEKFDEIEKLFLVIINLLEIPLTDVTSNSLPYIVAQHLKLLK